MADTTDPKPTTISGEILNTTDLSTPPKPGWRTSEFWKGIIVLTLVTLLGSGAIPTTGVGVQIAAIAGAVLTFLGYTGARTWLKSGAAMLLVFALAPSTGCDASKKPVAAVIDCGKADQAQLAALMYEIAPLLSGGSIDWGAIEADAVHAGVTIGGCVLSDLVQTVLGGSKAVTVTLSHDARSTLEHFRTTYAGGATFLVRGAAL